MINFCRVLSLSAAIAILSQTKNSRAQDTDAQSSPSLPFKIETVATGLEAPWSIVFAPDKRIFVTERAGRLRVIQDGKLTTEPLAGLQDVTASGEVGLMSVALHPKFAENRLLYLSHGMQNGSSITVAIVRYEERDNTLSNRKTFISDIPAIQFHAGCRMKFGPDEKLYVTTGDAGMKDEAQNLKSLLGKTLRLNDDGSVPADNPFVGRSDARPEIFSYGHRNSQGIDWQPDSGLQFQTEHGPSMHDGPPGGDEVNLVLAGKNYGWPIINHAQTRSGMESPVIEFTPAMPPGSAEFYNGQLFPDWKGSLLFGCLRGEALVRVKINGAKAAGYEKYLEKQYGRIREVAEAPDGSLYISTSNRDGYGKPRKNDDMILRLTPKQ